MRTSIVRTSGCWVMKGGGRCFESNTRGCSAEQCGLDTTTTLTLDCPGFLKLQHLLWPDHATINDASHLTLRIAAGEAALMAPNRYADEMTYHFCKYQLMFIRKWRLDRRSASIEAPGKRWFADRPGRSQSDR
jgi:hypothetical protein